MKDLGKYALYAVGYTAYCALCFLKIDDGLWLLPLMVWLAGLYGIWKKVLARAIDEEIAALKKATSKSDYIVSFLSVFFMMLIVIWVVVSGFQGKFQFNLTPVENLSFIEYLFGSIFEVLGLLLFLAFWIGVSAFVCGLPLLWNQEHCGDGLKFIPSTILFLMLCHACGLIDLLQAITHVSGSIIGLF